MCLMSVAIDEVRKVTSVFPVYNILAINSPHHIVAFILKSVNQFCLKIDRLILTRMQHWDRERKTETHRDRERADSNISAIMKTM